MNAELEIWIFVGVGGINWRRDAYAAFIRSEALGGNCLHARINFLLTFRFQPAQLHRHQGMGRVPHAAARGEHAVGGGQLEVVLLHHQAAQGGHDPAKLRHRARRVRRRKDLPPHDDLADQADEDGPLLQCGDRQEQELRRGDLGQRESEFVIYL